MFTRIYKYNNELNSYDVIKFIAIITMIIDHTGYFFVEDNDYLRAIGRLAAPLFFFITGYVPNYQIRRSIWVYGFILTGANFWFRHQLYINILIVFAAIKWVLEYWKPENKSILTLVIIFLLIYLVTLFSRDFIEYGFLGFAYAGCGRLKATRSKPVLASILIVVTFLVQMMDKILYHDNIYVILLILTVAAILFFLFSSFRYRVFQIKPLLKNSLLIFSRYSLEIYFWHLLAFGIIAQAMQI